jgi:two-component system cell cycle sensor histidine kinase/response regulator CckA
MERHSAIPCKYSAVLTAILVLTALYLTSLYNGLLAHDLAEIFGVIVACGIFMMGWNSRRFQDNNYFLFLGIAYLFVGGLEVFHLLTYPGMQVFHGDSSNLNLPMDLQIAARFVESASLLIAPLFINRKLKVRYVFFIYTAASLLLLGGAFFSRISPVYFIEGRGSTLLGKVAGSCICLILLASIAFLAQKRRELDPRVQQLMIISIAITAGSELIIAFLSVSAVGPFTMIAHFFKVLSFCVIYEAIISIGLMEPYQLLFRNLKQSEELLRKSSDQCEIRLERSTRELTIRNQISDIFLTFPDDQMYTEVLQVILRVMESKLGVFGYINQAGDMVFASLTRDVWDQCRIPDSDKKMIFPRKEWSSTWGQALIEKRTIRLDKPGFVPQGHIPIARALSVPIIHQGKVIGEIIVANKASDYTEKDQKLLETIVNSKVAPILYARLQREIQKRERRLADESIRTAYIELDQIFNTAADGMWVIDKEFHIMKTNRTLLTLACLTQDELAGKKCYEVFPCAVCHTPACPLTRILAGEEHVELDVIKERLNGSMISCLVSATPFRGPDGEMLGAVENFKDITERKQMEEELRKAKEEEEARYLTLVEQARDGVVIVSGQDGVWKFVNTAMTEITGYTAEEMIGRPFWEIAVPEYWDPLLQQYQLHLTGHDIPASYEARLQARDGTIKDVEVSAGLVQYQGKTAMLGIVRDITSRKRMEDELLKAQKLESIGILAGGIAHDFNNLLTAIIGNISLIEMHTKSGCSISGAVKNTEKASQQARELTQQLLTFSKGGKPVRKAASIAGLLKDAARLALSGSNVRYRLSIPDDLWWAEIDEGQINQVTNNLVINADQAMPGGGTIDIIAENIVVGTRDALPLKEGRYIKVSIRDQGIGIPQEYLHRIFDPYFTTKQKGSGLGLAICYSIIKKHAGYLTVKSTSGVGTTFSFYLPALIRETFIVEDIIEEGPTCGHGKILFMDDQEIIRDMAGEMLADLGYEVELARDGHDALEMYKKAKESGHAFDAVILDLTVPGGVGGAEVIQKLLEIDPHVKAIVSSGYSNDPIMSEYERHGFKGVVAKPYKVKDLSWELQKVVHKSMVPVSSKQ